MLKRIFILIFISTVSCSCDYLNFKKKDRYSIAKEQKDELLKAPHLDSYPEITTCEIKNDKTCFETQLTEHIYSHFTENLVTDQTPKKDTLWLTISVNKKGELSLNATNKIIESENYNLVKEKLEKALHNLSPIKPALLRGVPVNCNFKLPIVIGSE